MIRTVKVTGIIKVIRIHRVTVIDRVTVTHRVMVLHTVKVFHTVIPFTAPVCQISIRCSIQLFPALPQSVKFPYGVPYSYSLHCPSLSNFHTAFHTVIPFTAPVCQISIRRSIQLFPSLPQSVKFPYGVPYSYSLHCPSLSNFRAQKCSHTPLQTVYLMVL